MSRYDILQGDASVMLATLEPESVQTCVTSPPYFGLRDYGVDGQIGLENTPDAYVARLVGVFRQVRRVLKPDGTLWLNLGDSYAGGANSGGTNRNDGGPAVRIAGLPPKRGEGIKPKDLLGIPWRVAFALQADGWWLRSAIVWHKPNPMPESVTDRPTSSYEMVFLLAKSERYYYDAEAIAEPAECDRMRGPALHPDTVSTNGNGGLSRRPLSDTRNARNVWSIATQPFSEAHFAVMPPDLARKCVLAGSRENDLVLDPFNGAATTGVAALETFRRYLGVELNPDYIAISERRLEAIACQPGLFEEAAA